MDFSDVQCCKWHLPSTCLGWNSVLSRACQACLGGSDVGEYHAVCEGRDERFTLTIQKQWKSLVQIEQCFGKIRIRVDLLSYPFCVAFLGAHGGMGGGICRQTSRKMVLFLLLWWQGLFNHGVMSHRAHVGYIYPTWFIFNTLSIVCSKVNMCFPYASMPGSMRHISFFSSYALILRLLSLAASLFHLCLWKLSLEAALRTHHLLFSAVHGQYCIMP